MHISSILAGQLVQLQPGHQVPPQACTGMYLGVACPLSNAAGEFDLRQRRLVSRRLCRCVLLALSMQLLPSVLVLSAAGEVDLEKEEAAARKAPKPKRQRFEKYDDDFIDDSELEMVKGGGPTKTKFSGFYVTQVSQYQRLVLQCVADQRFAASMPSEHKVTLLPCIRSRWCMHGC
jgi:hypothetical protein